MAYGKIKADTLVFDNSGSDVDLVVSEIVTAAGVTFTGNVNFDDQVIVKGDSTNGSGALTLNCENNTHGIKIKGPPHSAGANYTLTLPNNTGTNGQVLTTNGSGVSSWSTIDLSSKLSLAGGQMTGNITFSGSQTVDGRNLSVDGTKLDGIETAATADQTAAEILTAIKTVDGASSGLDADLLDGQHGAYYTGYVDTAIANLIDSAPATLDTLNELAAALGDDPNFATTVTNNIATKLPLAGGTLTGGVTGTTANFSGNVGVGTTSPGGSATAYDGGLLHINQSAGSKGSQLRLTNTVTGTGAGDGSFISAWTDNGLYITNQEAAGIYFSNNGTERMRIDSSGKVGINQSSPTAFIHAKSGANDGTVIGTFEGATNNKLDIKFNSTGPALNVTAGDPLAFEIGGSERMRIDSSGNVLVGLTTAVGMGGTPADLNSVEIGRGFLNISRDDTAAADHILFGKNGSIASSIGTSTTNSLVFKTGTAERMRITSSGQVGIGTSSFNDAQEALRVQSSSGGTDTILTIKAQSDSGKSVLNFGDSDFNEGRVIYDHSSNSMQFRTDDSERMRIESGGNVQFVSGGSVFPTNDNSMQLGGGASYRWSQVWAANGTIQTSDIRTKTDVTSSSLGSDFIKTLRPVSYKWIEGGRRPTEKIGEDGLPLYESVPGVRTHWGFIAQEVKQAVDDADVDFGGWVLTDKDDDDSHQALRYDQFIAPLTKALQEAITEIETLKQRLSDAGIA